VTPKIPRTIPESFLAVRASPIHTAPTIAVNITVVEFSMAAREAVRCISAAEMSEKGTAELKNPSTRNDLHLLRIFGMRPTASE
jgi:hypothetical protein